MKFCFVVLTLTFSLKFLKDGDWKLFENHLQRLLNKKRKTS